MSRATLSGTVPRRYCSCRRTLKGQLPLRPLQLASNRAFRLAGKPRRHGLTGKMYEAAWHGPARIGVIRSLSVQLRSTGEAVDRLRAYPYATA
jgi:hypothetical protein